MKFTPQLLKFIMNVYGPFLGAGIKVEYISPDWRNIRVSMGLHWYNRNAVGVHFGGSLYSMVDPHLMLMYMQILGNEYIVWDKAAVISFLRPGKGKVTAEFILTEDDIQTAMIATENNQVYEPSQIIEVKDSKGHIVAKIKKDLYIRRKKHR
jgi:acyl-coenzyme A thioesterase PaaI-like protein